MKRENVRSRVQAKFNMTEEEYLVDRLNKGYSAHQIAKELGFSAPAVVARVRKVARKRSHWEILPEVAA